MRVRLLFLVFVVLFSSVSFSESLVSIVSKVKSIKYFNGILDGESVGKDGNYLKLDDKEINLMRGIFYPKYYPVDGGNVIGSGRWVSEKISGLESYPKTIQYKISCGDKLICAVIESDIFHWMATFSVGGDFIDAIPIYGWQSEWVKQDGVRKRTRKMALESDIFPKSQKLAEDIEAISAQTSDGVVFGISDAGLVCSRFIETSYVPHEHFAFGEMRLYKLTGDGHFELIQGESCVLSDEKIAKLGLSELANNARSGKK